MSDYRRGWEFVGFIENLSTQLLNESNFNSFAGLR
jgi:hypothetical protein